MGKVEEEQPLPLNVEAGISGSEDNADNNRSRKISKFVRFRCIIALIFGAAVLLSAIFWLPPFSRSGDQADLDPQSLLRARDVVASFELRRPVSVLNANIPQLELDIFEEMAIPNSTVVVISLEPSAVSNTIVVFAVVANSKNSNISSASISLLRSDFVSFILHQSSLRLSPSLFGDPFSFEVLKFKGGITVIPQQSAFLLQKVQILFDFTLNFSIHQILEIFDELKNQLKSGLHLSSIENLYVSLTNSYGSTVIPPTTIQASVLLAVRNRPPSLPRLKQLAQTITGSPAKNLGLNHTVFGRVKQVRLSSVLQHFLNSGGNSGPSMPPSPAPLPHIDHQRHNHHQHHQHHRHHDAQPAPSPSPQDSYQAKSPSGCHVGFTGKVKRHAYSAPSVAPVTSPHYFAASPRLHMEPPAPASHLLPGPSPLPAVVFAHAHPPNEKAPPSKPPDIAPMISPSPSSSLASCLATIKWSLSLLLPLITCFIMTN